VLFSDALTLDNPRRLPGSGYLVVRAKAAKTGVYQYTGREVDPDNTHGLRDAATVNVLRDESTVFDPAAVRTFIGKPVTDDHPSVAVTADNWREHGRGVIMGALRDGDHLAFDLLLMDGPTIDKVEAGKRQLSNGYAASIEFGDFTAPDGTKCPARQARISDGNHVAIVDRARGGETCRIGDAAICQPLPSNILDTLKTEKPVKTMLIDGLTVDIANADTAQATITRLIEQRDTAATKLTDADAKVATLTTEKATLDAKVVTLEQAVKDAKPTPAQLRDAGKALMLTAGKAKALGVTVTDAMDECAIMAATVNAKMGDAAKGWTVDQIAASFAVLTKDAKVGDTAIQPINAPVIVDGVKDATDARAAMIADMLKPTTAAA
jgi:hypothetical protein